MSETDNVIPLNVKLFVITVGVMIGVVTGAGLNYCIDEYLYNQSSYYETVYWQEFKKLESADTMDIVSLNPLQYHLFSSVPYFNVRLNGSDISLVRQNILNSGWQEESGYFIKTIDGKEYKMEMGETDSIIELNIYCIP